MSSISNAGSSPESDEFYSVQPEKREIVKPRFNASAIKLPSGKTVELGVLFENIPDVPSPAESRDEIWNKKTLFTDLKMYFNAK